MTDYTAFEDHITLTKGDMQKMTAAQRDALQRSVNLSIYDDATRKVLDLDLRDAPPPAHGRPKMGVKAREITLLPSHWDWLSGQKGGASAVLRRLIDDAIRTSAGLCSDHERQTILCHHWVEIYLTLRTHFASYLPMIGRDLRHGLPLAQRRP